MMKTACSALLVLAAVAGANLLINPDFSEWTTPTRPLGWTVEDTTRTRVDRSDSSRSLPYSARLVRMVDSIGNNKGLSQLVPVTPDQIYTLSAWFRLNHPYVKGGVSITWRKSDTSFISNSGVSYTDTLNSDWQRVSKADTAPSTAAFADVLLRIYNRSAQTPAGGWLFIDDAELVLGSGVSETSVPPPARAQLNVEPNPVAGRCRVELVLPDAMTVTLAVYDLSGTKRAELFSGRVASGRHAINWQGEDNFGQPLPQGLYFIILAGEAGPSLVRKVVIGI